MSIGRAFDQTKYISEWDMDANQNFKYDYEELAIGGKLLSVSHTLSLTDSLKFKSDDDFKNAIKKELVKSLTEYMIQQKLVEVTFKQDPAMHTMTIHARAYVAPDSQVKLLRLSAK
jgi:hypothetical protein